MNRILADRHRSLALGLAAAVLTLVAAPTDADAAVAYVRSTVGAPWGETANEQAMDLAFGAGAWDDLRFETVPPGTLLSGTYTFIYLEGSDTNATELENFLIANQAALEAWVSAGGQLFLNAAPNEGGDQNWGFGGIVLNNGDFPTDPGMAVDATHPIWNGPFLPTSPAGFTGGSYAHASVSGPGLMPLIIDSDGGNPNLAELPFGAGTAIFGGLTTSNFWSPTPEALNLRANIIAYLAAGGAADTDLDGISDGLDNCPMIANATQEDLDMDGLGDVCDPCPMTELNDEDMDLTCDDVDNCVGVSNPMQQDEDMDGQGNDCDPCPADPDDDLDGDTICGDVDNCPAVLNADQADEDMDGLGDSCDECPGDPINDPDGDMICASEDNCPEVANEDQADADGNGIGDACEGAVGTTGGDETGDESGDATGVGTTGDMAGDSSGGTGGGETGIDLITTGGDSGSGSGCACTADPRGAAGWWLVLLGGFGLRRRRRRAA